MDLIELLAQELGQTVRFVENVVRLLDEGNTIPFIARYRKEQHGGMDDTTLRTLEERLTYLRNLDKRRQEVKSAIENQGKLTEALVSAIDAAATLTEVEDLYRPYKQSGAPGLLWPGKRDWNRWRRCCLPRSAPAPTRCRRRRRILTRKRAWRLWRTLCRAPMILLPSRFPTMRPSARRCGN